MKIIIFIKQADTNDTKLSQLCTHLSDRLLAYQIINVESAVEPIEVQAYDITSTPSVVVARDDGVATKTWRHHLPSVEQVAYALGNI